MRSVVGLAIAALSASMVIQANAAFAQSFDERFSVIPEAHAEQPPQAAPSPDTSKPPEAAETSGDPAPQAQAPAEPPPMPTHRAETDQPPKQSFIGKASFYDYKNAKTASGETFDRDQPTAAHRSLPFGTKVRVTNLGNHESVIVTITDRGPHTRDRVLDLSLDAARAIGMTDRGVAEVRAEVL